MKIIDKPTLSASDVYDSCVASVSNVTLKSKFVSIRSAVLNGFIDYENKAANAHLYLIKSCSWGEGGQLIISNVTKKEFSSLYGDSFAAEGSAGRSYYHALKMLAPLGKCPYCGFGHVSTLDHFLAKSRYPAFSIFPLNLVPSCADCNKGKGSTVLDRDSQTLHPYFEDKEVEEKAWLHAELLQTSPLTIDYKVDVAQGWSDELAKRIDNHFFDFDLARRFAVEAASELAGLIDLLDDMPHEDDRREHLSRVARVERKSRPNGWKAALYDVLKNSRWYIQGGYKSAATK